MLKRLFFLLLPLLLFGETFKEVAVEAQAALQLLRSTHPAAKRHIERAAAILVFPKVYKLGFVICGEYGKGVLFEHGRTAGYYELASLSLGPQIGAQRRSIVIIFLDPAAYREFLRKEGFEIGVDGSVAVLQWGVADEVGTLDANKPIVAYVFDSEGLMLNLTLEGTRIWRVGP